MLFGQLDMKGTAFVACSFFFGRFLRMALPLVGKAWHVPCAGLQLNTGLTGNRNITASISFFPAWCNCLFVIYMVWLLTSPSKIVTGMEKTKRKANTFAGWRVVVVVVKLHGY